MKKFVLALAVMASASAVQAQPRPFTPRMPCGQIQQTVFASGAVVLSTGANTYDRYVRDRSFCQINEFIEAAWVPAQDTPQCPVYRCTDDDPFLFGD
ncbi:hypothetical protein [Microvirga lenta]|uniref:hypothetical protein n=1 Tax=Microvirga lenta TaxID=2881337 RepID=UPI001CFFC582|nr:hypothetical protein [Microvirga lenta]MCB5176616.1 hypothetical protein [Microvirga lenta]